MCVINHHILTPHTHTQTLLFLLHSTIRLFSYLDVVNKKKKTSTLPGSFFFAWCGGWRTPRWERSRCFWSTSSIQSFNLATGSILFFSVVFAFNLCASSRWSSSDMCISEWFNADKILKLSSLYLCPQYQLDDTSQNRQMPSARQYSTNPSLIGQDPWPVIFRSMTYHSNPIA